MSNVRSLILVLSLVLMIIAAAICTSYKHPYANSDQSVSPLISNEDINNSENVNSRLPIKDVLVNDK